MREKREGGGGEGREKRRKGWGEGGKPSCTLPDMALLNYDT